MAYFLNEKQTTRPVANILMKSLMKYDDVYQEFNLWLENRNYAFETPLTIGGYTAMQIHEIEPSLDAAGIYNFMITLRDNPAKAISYIENGFPRK